MTQHTTIWIDEKRAMDTRSVYVSFSFLLTRNSIFVKCSRKGHNSSVVGLIFLGGGGECLKTPLPIYAEVLPYSSVLVGILDSIHRTPDLQKGEQRLGISSLRPSALTGLKVKNIFQPLMWGN